MPGGRREIAESINASKKAAIAVCHQSTFKFLYKMLFPLSSSRYRGRETSH